MGRQAARDTAAGKAAKKEVRSSRAKADAGPANALLIGARVTLLLFVLGFGYAASAAEVFYSAAEGKTHIFARFLFFVVAQAAASELLVILLLQLGRRLCGETARAPCEPTREELAVNDPKLPWPPAHLLSSELRAFASKPGQPFFLNHVSGRHRCKDACMRVGMNLASLLVVCYTCRWLDRRSLASIGLALDATLLADAAAGLAVGVGIVAFIFAVELAAGWVCFLRFFEVVEPSERFAVCLFWDVVFHLNVALNEELPLRGWMLHNLADAFAAHLGAPPLLAAALAVLTESGFFVAMHLRSPGGSRCLSMVNIFVGGVAAGLNVALTGGRLGFALGWHFGWNISMGNVFGLSTSGIPISATFVSVAPHPAKKALHGGEFGPEGGLVAPLAYALGVLLLWGLYGLPGGAGPALR